MANKTINQLTEDTSPTSDDYFATWDAGSGATKKVTLLNLQAFLRTNYAFWEILGSTTLGSAGDTISITSFTARKYLAVYCHLIASGVIGPILRFNNDSATNYATRRYTDWTTSATDTSTTSITVTPDAAATDKFIIANIINVLAKEKLVRLDAVGSNTAGAANVPQGRSNYSKWANTSAQITRIDISQASAGDFAIGSQLIVLGHD